MIASRQARSGGSVPCSSTICLYQLGSNKVFAAHPNALLAPADENVKVYCRERLKDVVGDTIVTSCRRVAVDLLRSTTCSDACGVLILSRLVRVLRTVPEEWRVDCSLRNVFQPLAVVVIDTGNASLVLA